MFSVREVAKYLRVTKPTVYRLIETGQLIAVRTGIFANSGYRVTEESFRAFLNTPEGSQLLLVPSAPGSPRQDAHPGVQRTS